MKRFLPLVCLSTPRLAVTYKRIAPRPEQSPHPRHEQRRQANSNASNSSSSQQQQHARNNVSRKRKKPGAGTLYSAVLPSISPSCTFTMHSAGPAANLRPLSASSPTPAPPDSPRIWPAHRAILSIFLSFSLLPYSFVFEL